MNFKNLKIGTQLKLGFAAMLIFVIILGITSYLQSDKIQKQTETLYFHPLKVLKALGEIRADVLSYRQELKFIDTVPDEKDISHQLSLAEDLKSKVFEQLYVLYSNYLGPRPDIDTLKNIFTEYYALRTETIRQFRNRNYIKTPEYIIQFEQSELQLKAILSLIEKIGDFADNKAESLYKSSNELNDQLTIKLLTIIVVIILLSLLINYFLLQSIRKPLLELTDVTKRFHEGEMDARILYESKNELGELAVSFNTMATGIENTANLNEKITSFSKLLLSKYEAKEFFRETLNALATYTGSQMAAVYLLSEDRKTFEHFESIGVDDNARHSFAADHFEGEFGLAISTRMVQYTKDIPEDSRFVFHTVSGKFQPHEIISIPILTNNEVVAVISLASIKSYSVLSVQLIETVLATLRARIEGIIAYHKMRNFSEKLENQNRELESQKTELATQSAELQEQNAELETQKNQLSEANQLKTNFLSNMSHELRTPLNSVIALAGVLNRRLSNQIPDEEYSYLEIIERNGKHLLALINDILDISRIEAGREEVEITRFDIKGLISEIITTIEHQAKQKSIDLFQTSDHTDPKFTGKAMYIQSDAVKCRHILQNLISNAVKFTEKGKVEVKSGQSDNAIEISVSDTGIGISEMHQPHIFDEFRQADSSTSRRFGGTGLGLAIAKKYANLLGGTISVKSTPGSGSEFTLTLPLHYFAEKQVSRAEPMAEKINPGIQTGYIPVSTKTVKTILMVEDSQPAIIQINDVLGDSGYKILAAHDGKEALAIIAHTIPDAIILDLMMPDMDGFEVLQTLREAEQTAYVPVLILTAKHITKDELRFLKRNNIHQLIQKGEVNPDELLRAVASMVYPQSKEVIIPQRKMQHIDGKPSVLIVEDNPDNMISIKALLDGNYIILEAVNGIEAVKMAKLHKPNLILMDIALPEMDGIEAFKVIRKDAYMQQIPVIALTASAMTSDREAILAYGFDSYIAKPIDDNLFFITLNEVLYGK
jgi:signal transduction histidine kinase/CheY-like chemotaxis protein/HAMP domain-containing protein